MRLSCFRPLMLVLAIVVAALAVPVDAQPQGLTVTDHSFTYAQSTTGTAGVREVLEIQNGGGDSFSGSLPFTLDASAGTVQMLIERGTEAVAIMSEDLSNTSAGGLTTYSFTLSDHNLSIASGSVLRAHLFYSVSPDGAQRRIDMPTDRFIATFAVGGAKAPEAEGFEIVYWETRGFFTTLPNDADELGAGDTFRFTITDLAEPLQPLTVRVSTSGQETLRLTAQASGGIAPYTFAWDTDGDGAFETEGERIDVESGLHTYTVRVTDSQSTPVLQTTTYTVNTRTADGENGGTTAPSPRATTNWVIIILAAVFGALVMYGLAAGGLVKGRAPSRPSTPTSGRTIGAESKDMLELRKRTQVAALKELEIAKKKGEVPDGLYLPLKEELKGETVRVMRELERRENEAV